MYFIRHKEGKIRKNGFLPVLIVFFLFTSFHVAFSQFRSSYPDIPRIDVHTHLADDSAAIVNYLELGELMKKQHAIDLAMWINLGSRDTPIPDMEKAQKLGQGRILCAIADYSAHDGLEHDPQTLKDYQQQGYIGYKIWAGPWYRALDKKEDGYPYIDNPVHEPTFAEMEKIGFMGASVHIADPNGPFGKRTKWLADPIEYWHEITAWRNVLERHPKLKVVMAHSNWLICQDAQLDYLRNMLATFPNLNLDLAATFQYYHLVSRENLREFMIEWSDRILFGTDVGAWSDPTVTSQRAEQYFRAFKILETNENVERGFFGGSETKGLNLPEEVLEKIYYKNAMRLYPNVRDSLIKLGYEVE